MSKIKQDILNIIHGDDEEANPWEENEQDTTNLMIPSHEDIAKAVEGMNKPKPPRPSILIIFNQFFVIIWILGHFALLYAMLGTPISGGILIYVIISLFFNGHYFMLLNKERKRR